MSTDDFYNGSGASSPFYGSSSVITTEANMRQELENTLDGNYPEIAKGLEDGLYSSVSEAERVAGIRKPKMSAVEKVVRAYQRLTESEQKEFCNETM